MRRDARPSHHLSHLRAAGPVSLVPGAWKNTLLRAFLVSRAVITEFRLLSLSRIRPTTVPTSSTRRAVVAEVQRTYLRPHLDYLFIQGVVVSDP